MGDLKITVHKSSWLDIDGEQKITDEWTTEIHSPDPGGDVGASGESDCADGEVVRP